FTHCETDLKYLCVQPLSSLHGANSLLDGLFSQFGHGHPHDSSGPPILSLPLPFSLSLSLFLSLSRRAGTRTHALKMERANRPPPLNLTPPHSRQSSVSKTISTKGRSPTTTISVFEVDDWNTGRLATFLRVLGDFAHILICMILILIMAFYLNYKAVVSGTTG